MKNVSLEWSLVWNLKNASKHHKKYCEDAQCNVSLIQLRTAAKYVRETAIKNELVNEAELKEIDRMIEEMPTI